MTFLETIFSGLLVRLIADRLKKYFPKSKTAYEPEENTALRGARILAIVGTGLIVFYAPFAINGILALIVAASHPGISPETMSITVSKCLLGSALFRSELTVLVWMLLAVFLPGNLANIILRRRNSPIWRFLIAECNTASSGGVAFALLSTLSILGLELIAQVVPAARYIF